MRVDYQAMQVTFGRKFKMLRHLAGRTEAETAMLLKKPLITYIRLEGDFLYPTEAMLRRVAKLYHITYQELLAYGE